MKKQSPKKGSRLPLPKKAGAAMGTKKGAKGYKRTASKVRGGKAFVHDISYVKPSYETINHTADLGIKVTGESLEKLFEHAGLALFDLLTELSRVRPDTRLSFSLGAENLEALLVEWLRELLYMFYGQKRLFCAIEITQLNETSLSAIAWGESLDLKRHIFLSEIKAVTYHELSVTKTDSGWSAQVIFDI